MHTLALWVEPTRYRDFIPVLSEIEHRCKVYQMDFEMEFHRFMERICRNLYYHHPKFSMNTLEADILTFRGHLHCRGDSFENWNKLHSHLYRLTPAIIFRRGGEIERAEENQGREMCMRYLELYARM